MKNITLIALAVLVLTYACSTQPSNSLAIPKGDTIKASNIYTTTPKPVAKSDYKVLKTFKGTDEYGPATKYYIYLKDSSKLDLLNGQLLSDYKQTGKFLQIWYYSDKTMNTRLGVYTYNPQNGFESLDKDE